MLKLEKDEVCLIYNKSDGRFNIVDGVEEYIYATKSLPNALLKFGSLVVDIEEGVGE